MSRFAQYNKVLYVEPVVYLNHLRHHWREGKLGWSDFKQKPVSQAGDNLYIFHSPAYVPISGRQPLKPVSRFAWTGLLKLAMRQLGFGRPIVWFSRPEMVDLIGSFDEKLVVYHVVDEYLAYGGLNSEARRRQQCQEQQMLQRAGLVIVVSEKLYEAKRPFNQHTHLVANGVDYQAYDRAMSSTDPLLPDIGQLSRPVIGYSGSVATRLDLDLLHYLATSHPDWSIVLVGVIKERDCAAGLSKLRQAGNVHFLGHKEINQVPYYVKGFDVCLIPYKVNERAHHSSPLKLYDYMATGKPIVSTDFASANQFKDVIRIARSKENFKHSIEEVLTEKDNGLSGKRRSIAAENTWDARVNQLSALIQNRLDAGN